MLAANVEESSSSDDDEDDGAAVDEDEPTYCVCKRISFGEWALNVNGSGYLLMCCGITGEMICCDYSWCAIEWFIFSCVGLKVKPKREEMVFSRV